MELIYTQFSFSQGFMLLVYVAFGLKPEIFFSLVKKISFSSSFRINRNRKVVCQMANCLIIINPTFRRK